MKLGIQSDVASTSAHRPVLIFIAFDFIRLTCAVTALDAVMAFPLCAFRTNRVITSHIRCRFCAAILAHLAVVTDICTIFTFHALIADICTVRAVFAAVDADVIDAVTAIIAVTAHCIGTVDADATVRAELVNTAGTLTAVLTNIFRTVTADYAAILADFRAVAAKLTVLTPYITRTLAADVTRKTEFVRAVGAFFITVRADIHTVFAAFSARTYKSAVGAKSAGYTEAVRAGAVNTFTAFRTHLSVRTFAALFAALKTDCCAVRAALTTAKAYIVHAVFADLTCIAEATVTAHTFAADAAVGAQLIRCAVGTFLTAFLTDHIDTVGTASTAADTDVIHAEFTDRASVTEVIVATDTVATGTAFGAQIIRCAV